MKIKQNKVTLNKSVIKPIKKIVPSKLYFKKHNVHLRKLPIVKKSANYFRSQDFLTLQHYNNFF